MWSRLCYWCVSGTISVTQKWHILLLLSSVYPWRAPNYHIPSDGPSSVEWSHPDLSAARSHPSYNPTTMDKTILMQREARGLVQPITCSQRGSAVIYMLMLLLEGVETGQGGPCWAASWGGFWGNMAQTSSQCGNPSAGPHLVHQGHLHAA